MSDLSIYLARHPDQKQGIGAWVSTPSVSEGVVVVVNETGELLKGMLEEMHDLVVEVKLTNELLNEGLNTREELEILRQDILSEDAHGDH